MVEHIVHIDGVTGSSPVATTKIPGRKAWDNLFLSLIRLRYRRIILWILYFFQIKTAILWASSALAVTCRHRSVLPDRAVKGVRRDRTCPGWFGDALFHRP